MMRIRYDDKGLRSDVLSTTRVHWQF